MNQPDFMPNGAPISRPMPFADPPDVGKPAKGFPPGVSPPPKEDLPARSLPPTSPDDVRKPDRYPRLPGDFSRDKLKRPIDLSKPKKVDAPRNSPRGKIKIRWTDVIQYILEDNPSSDGTIPDYDSEPGPDDEYPDDSNEPELQQGECADAIRYPALKGKPYDSLVQIQYVHTEGYALGTYGFSDYVPKITIHRKTYVRGDIPKEFGNPSGYRAEFAEFGRRTRVDLNGRIYKIYKFGVRDGFRRSGDGRFVWMGWSMFSSIPLPTDVFRNPTVPQLLRYVGSGEVGRYFKGATLRDVYGPSAYPCEEEENEPQDPNDYDRKNDEDNMACKWKPTNDPRVESLEETELEYEKFIDCEGGSNRDEPFFRTARINAPTLMHPVLVKILNEMEIQKSKVCSISSPVLVLPDWMPAKWANMSKLVVLYAEKDSQGKYKSAKYMITIPHWGKGETSTEVADFPILEKGQYQCILEFKDGSRITLNAITAIAAKQAMEKIVVGLEPGYSDAIVPDAGVRGGKKIAEITVYPVEARYFIKGKEDLIPGWIVDFR